MPALCSNAVSEEDLKENQFNLPATWPEGWKAFKFISTKVDVNSWALSLYSCRQQLFLYLGQRVNFIFRVRGQTNGDVPSIGAVGFTPGLTGDAMAKQKRRFWFTWECANTTVVLRCRKLKEKRSVWRQLEQMMHAGKTALSFCLSVAIWHMCSHYFSFQKMSR